MASHKKIVISKSLNEYVNTDKLKIIIDDFESLYPQISKYFDYRVCQDMYHTKEAYLCQLKKTFESKMKNFKVNYHFTDKNCNQREYVYGLNLSNISRIIRHTICKTNENKDIYIDVDIDNCHYRCAKFLCKKYNINSDGIDYYLENKSTCRESLANLLRLTKDGAKQFLLKILNLHSWEAIDSKQPEWVDKLQINLSILREKVFVDSEYAQIVKQKKDLTN